MLSTRALNMKFYEKALLAKAEACRNILLNARQDISRRDVPTEVVDGEAIISGEPLEGIVRYSTTRGVNLITMPTSGKGIRRRSMLGSTTEDVLRHASCAVWTESGNSRPHVRWSPVLCAIDLERENKQQLLSRAAHIAEQLCANLVVVHAIAPVSENVPPHSRQLSPALSQASAPRALERVLEGLDLFAEPITDTGPFSKRSTAWPANYERSF
jgi:hypothetical protein